MNYTIENIDLSLFPLGFPSSLLMVCQDFMDGDTTKPGEPRPILVTLGDPTHRWAHRYDLFEISLMHDGKPAEYELLTTPAGVKATTEYGTFALAFEDNMCLRLQTKGDLDLRFYIKFEKFEQFFDRCDGTVQASFRPLSGDFVLECQKGTQTYETKYNSDEARSENTYVYWKGTDGLCEGYLNYRDHDVERRGAFSRSIEQCFEDNMANFREFYAKTYKCPDESIRGPYDVCAYMIWSNYMHDYREVTGYAVNMSKGGNMRYAKAWHQAMHGMAAWRNLEFSLELIYQIPSKADKFGMASGGINTVGAQYTNPMPPIQGWALTYVVKRHGGWDCISKEWAQKLYTVLSRWTNWWRNFSDVDGDGIVGYTNSDSSGWNDATMFAGGIPAICPDISAWLTVQSEACGHLAEILGNKNDADYWYNTSKHMLDDMIAKLWDGEKFVVINEQTGETVENSCIALYQVVMLGDRLPEHIRAKLIETLKDTSKFLVPQGFTTEAQDSKYYDVVNFAMMHGRIFAMANLYVTFGLYACGAKDFALERARVWAEQAKEMGPQTIVPGPKQTWDPLPFEAPVFDTLPRKFTPASLNTWGCGVYLNIAEMLSENFDC